MTLDTNVLPEKQKPQLQNKQVDENRPRLGQGRAGIRCRKPQPVDDITASTGKSHKLPTAQNFTKDIMDFPVPEQLISGKTEAITWRLMQDKNRELPFYPDPIYRPPPRTPEKSWPNSLESKPDTRSKIDVEFVENSLHQEGIRSKFYQRPDKSYFQEPRDLESLINTGRLFQKFLPKQANVDKILKVIQWKVLKRYALISYSKEIQVGNLNSSYFKDIYLYLAQNRLPSSKAAIRKVEALLEKYILLDSLLFKIISTTDKETAVLAVPDKFTNKIITLYHASLFTGHQGIIKNIFNYKWLILHT